MNEPLKGKITEIGINELVRDNLIFSVLVEKGKNGVFISAPICDDSEDSIAKIANELYATFKKGGIFKIDSEIGYQPNGKSVQGEIICPSWKYKFSFYRPRCAVFYSIKKLERICS